MGINGDLKKFVLSFDNTQNNIAQRYGDLCLENNWYIIEEKNNVKNDVSINDFTVRSSKEKMLPTGHSEWTEVSEKFNIVLDHVVELQDKRPEAYSYQVCVTNTGNKKVTLRLVQEINGLLLQGKAFAPSGKDFYNPGSDDINLSYRGRARPLERICMPLATLFEEESDIGFTIAGHMEMPLPPFKFRMDRASGKAFLERTALNLNPGKSVTLRHYFIRHEGCWRPGLGWIREKFAKFFTLQDRKWLDIHGCYINTRITDRELCNQIAAEGAKMVQIMCTFPFIGKYVPESDPWVMNADEKWVAVKCTTDPSAPPEDAPYDIDYRTRQSGRLL